MICCKLASDDLGVRLDDHLAGLGIDDIVECVSAFEISRSDLDLVLAHAAKIGERRLCDLFALADNIFFLVLDVLFGTHPDEVRFALWL